MKNTKNELKRQNKILLDAIKRKCYDCSGYSWPEVKLCVIPHCALFPYRTGQFHPTNRTQDQTQILHGKKEQPSEKQQVLTGDNHQ